MAQVVVIEPFVSVGPVHFGMDYEAANAAIGGLAPAFTPGQARYVQAGTLIVVEFDDDGLVEGVSMSPDRKHGGVVAELDGLLLKGRFTKLEAKLTERGVRILPSMPPYPADREPMMHLPDQGINIGCGGTPRVDSVWAGRAQPQKEVPSSQRGVIQLASLGIGQHQDPSARWVQRFNM